MLHVRETHVEKPRYPVIDFHTHITFSAKGEKGVPMVAERRYNAAPEELLQVMDSKNLRTMVNLTGGYGSGLAETVKKYDKLFPDRFYTFTEPMYSQIMDPDYPRKQAEAIEQAHRDGARGLKILKTLGLYLRENVTTRKTDQDRRSEIRSHVGRVRAVEDAGGDSHLRPFSLLSCPPTASTSALKS